MTNTLLGYNKLKGLTDKEELELHKISLSNARVKLSLDINHGAREFYLKEVESLTNLIKDKVDKQINYY